MPCRHAYSHTSFVFYTINWQWKGNNKVMKGEGGSSSGVIQRPSPLQQRLRLRWSQWWGSSVETLLATWRWNIEGKKKGDTWPISSQYYRASGSYRRSGQRFSCIQLLLLDWGCQAYLKRLVKKIRALPHSLIINSSFLSFVGEVACF